LGHEILLVAALVGLTNDLLGAEVLVVRDVKKVARLDIEKELTALLADQLPKSDHAIGPLARTGRVVELGDFLVDQGLLEVAALADDVVLDPRLLAARVLGFEGALRLANELGDRP